MTKLATDEKIEKLALTIQKYMGGNPAILIGSGCSVPYGLPSMGHLADEIIRKLGPTYKSEISWTKFIEQLTLTDNLETALEVVPVKEEIHDAIIQVIWEVINQKDNEAFLGFMKTGYYPSLTKIINKCVQSAVCTNIITTNYDRLVEYSIDAAEGKCICGFVGNHVKRFQNFDMGTPKRVINVYKVHGSIDWFKHKSNGNTISVNFHCLNDYCDTYQPLIVTPGSRKYRETHNDPFRTVISEADKAIRSSVSYLCVGYGFNDEHIQPIIIDENRNKNKPIIIVTKGITKRMHELFLNSDDCQCLIISENSGGGTHVYFNRSETEVYNEQFWQLDSFSKLWLG